MDKNELLKIIEMPEGAVETIRRIERSATDPSFAAEMEKIRSDFFSGSDVKGAIRETADRCSLNADELALWSFLYCSDETGRRFREQGHPTGVFTDGMRDLTIWAKVCHHAYRVWGIREFDWLSRTARAQLWRFGRLQFEYEIYEYDDYSAGGYAIKRGDRIINVHIPAGEPFPPQARLESYKQAYEYFGINAFMCESYLLYPPQEKYLKPDSNIVSFMHEYHIVKVIGGGGSLYNLRYVFGHQESYDITKLPRDTSVRRAFIDMIAETGEMGVGVGVLFFDGEKIIN